MNYGYIFLLIKFVAVLEYFRFVVRFTVYIFLFVCAYYTSCKRKVLKNWYMV